MEPDCGRDRTRKAAGAEIRLDGRACRGTRSLPYAKCCFPLADTAVVSSLPLLWLARRRTFTGTLPQAARLQGIQDSILGAPRMAVHQDLTALLSDREAGRSVAVRRT